MNPLVVVSTVIQAPATLVWHLISDVTAMGRWSPETTRCQWLGEPAAPVVGARFRGHNEFNKRRWYTDCTVTAAQPGQVFSFDVKGLGVIPIAEWSYTFAALSEDSCRVNEAFMDRRPFPLKMMGNLVLGIPDRGEHNRVSMTATLAALKKAAEVPDPSSIGNI